MNAEKQALAGISPLLPYPAGCRVGHLVRREKRFSMAVILTEADGSCHEVWAHTNNTGSMMGLLRPGAPVLLSPAAHPGRKLPWTVEALALPAASVSAASAASFSAALPPFDIPSGSFFWVGVNTSVPNRFLSAAFKAGLLPWTAGYTDLRREAVYVESRLDGLCTGPGLPPLWIECKNVTLVEDDRAAFPDAVTERGAKHLGTLQRLVRQGSRAAMLYLIQRPDARCFGPADYIDPLYTAEFGKAKENGVEIHSLVATVSPLGISLSHEME